MLEKLYELWSIEKRVSVTIKSVGLNCTFTTVIENIYKGEDSVVLEFGDNNMKLDVTENCTCNEYEMTVVYNETTITINWEKITYEILYSDCCKRLMLLSLRSLMKDTSEIMKMQKNFQGMYRRVQLV